MNKQVKSLLEDLIDDYIRDYAKEIWFLDLIDELANYGLRNTDRAMAFGICLIHNIDNYRMRVKETEESLDIGLKYYKRSNNGTPIKLN